MSFIRYCDPIFQYISLLEEDSVNKNVTYAQVREDISNLLEELKKSVSSDSHNMWMIYEETYLPLLCFIDYKITNSGYSFAEEWDKNRLAYSESCYTGDKKFFLLLDKSLKEKAYEKEDILIFFHVCITLGFLGVYAQDKNKIKNYLWEIGKRVKLSSIEEGEKFSSSVYKNIISGKILKPRAWYLTVGFGVSIALVALYLILCFIFYSSSTSSYVDTLSKMGKQKKVYHILNEKADYQG